MRERANRSRAGVYDCWVECPSGTESLDPAIKPEEPAGQFQPVVLEAEGSNASPKLIKSPGKLPFRQDFWNKRRDDMQMLIACRLTQENPERSTEEIMAAARKFTDTVGTLVGAVRRGFIEPNAGIMFETDGFKFPVVLKPPDDSNLREFGG